MADPVVANIMKTGAALYFGPVGETIPDEGVAYGTAWGGNWVRMGYTKEQLLWIYEDERHRAAVEEELTPLREWRISEETRLETVLAEVALTYYELARGGDVTDVATTAAGAGQVGFEELNIGGATVVQEYAYGFEGEYLDAAGASFPARVFIHKGVGKLNGELTFSRKEDDYTGIPIQINALADTTQSAGEKLMKIQRVTAAATS